MFKTLRDLKANYFLPERERYTPKPEAPEEVTAKHAAAGFCTSLESRAPLYFFTVFLLVWKATGAALVNV